MAQRISVIVPIYNVARDLPRCLDSILAQTYPHIEIVAVDDGSRDDSGAVLDRYGEKYSNIRVVHKENGGVTSARLRGVAEASGEWIGFVDGDDEIEPDMYERLLKNARAHGADISHCGYQMVFADGRVHYFHDSGLVKEQDAPTALRDLLEGTLVEPGLWNKLYRRDLFAGLAEGMDPSIRINEDLLMNYYLFSAAGKAVFEDWCPYHYIVRSSSASRTKLNEHKLYDPIRVKEIILADVPEELRPDAQKALVNTCVYTYCGLVTDASELAARARGELRGKLRTHRAWLPLLPKRTRLLAELIVRTPRLFGFLYPIYAGHFQKQKYN